jgi:hypothetical protein
MASIQKRKTAKGFSYDVIYYFEGKQVWRCAGSRKIDATRLKAQIENNIHLGVHREMPEIGLKDFSVKWINAKRGDIRPATLYSYEGHIRNQIVPYFGNRPLSR